MADLKDFADKLVGLTVKEVNELANILKEEHGIEPAAAAAVAVPAAGSVDGDSSAEEKTESSVSFKQYCTGHSPPRGGVQRRGM